MNTTMTQEQTLAYMSASEHQTNHVLHLILTITTFGLWSFVWLFVASSNMKQRNKIKSNAGMPTQFNFPRLLLWIDTVVMVLFISIILFGESLRTAKNADIANHVAPITETSTTVNTVASNVYELPACDSDHAKETLKNAFDGSQAARVQGLALVETYNIKDVSTGNQVRKCTAEAMLNNTEKREISYQLTYREDSHYLMEFAAN